MQNDYKDSPDRFVLKPQIMSMHESQKSPIRARRGEKLSPKKNMGEFYDAIEDQVQAPEIILQPVRISNCTSEATTPYQTDRYDSSEGRAKKQRRSKASRSKSNGTNKRKNAKKEA